MSKIRAKLETSFTQSAEHKNFLKQFDLKNVSTSKTKEGGKFFCFTVKGSDELKKLEESCVENRYNLIVE
jgi:hypothetical protein